MGGILNVGEHLLSQREILGSPFLELPTWIKGLYLLWGMLRPEASLGEPHSPAQDSSVLAGQ